MFHIPTTYSEIEIKASIDGKICFLNASIRDIHDGNGPYLHFELDGVDLDGRDIHPDLTSLWPIKGYRLLARDPASDALLVASFGEATIDMIRRELTATGIKGTN